MNFAMGGTKLAQDAPVARRLSPRPGVIPAAAIIFFGLAVATVQLVTGVDSDRLRIEAFVNRQADWRALSLADAFERKRVAFELIAHAVGRAGGGDQPLNAAVVDILARHGDLQIDRASTGLYWAPRVPRENLADFLIELAANDSRAAAFDLSHGFERRPLDDRPEQFIVAQGETLNEDHVGIGLAVLGHPVLGDATRRALAQRSPVATPLMPWSTSGERSLGYYTVTPVFRPDDRRGQQPAIGVLITSQIAIDSTPFDFPPATQASQAGPEEPVSAADLLNQSLRGTPGAMMRAEISAPLWSEGGTIEPVTIAVLDPSTNRFTLVPSQNRSAAASSIPPIAERHIDNLGQPWRIAFFLPPATLADMTSSAPLGWFMAIVLASAGLATYVGRVRRRDAATQLLAARREVQLQETFRSLDYQVAARNAAELQARSAEFRLQAIIANSPIAIVVTNPNRAVEVWNRAAESIFGLPERQALWKPLSALFQRVALRSTIPNQNPQESRQVVEEDVLTKDGRKLTLRYRSAPILETNGESQGEIHLYADITAQVDVERKLRQSQKMEAVGQLTGGLAHDFNNLLAIITANLDLLEPLTAKRPKTRRRLNSIRTATASGARLTRRLLAFARQQPLTLETVDVRRVVKDQIKLLRRTIGEDIAIKEHHSENHWLVRADPVELATAITNLALNARDAMPSGGQLTFVSASVSVGDDASANSLPADLAPGDYVRLDVSDSGAGMTAEILDRIFLPFFTTKPEGRGTGLGLSMVFGFMKQIGGGIAVASSAGSGTTFSLYLPRAPQTTDLAPLSGSGRRDQHSVPTMAPARPVTVLVVDDNVEVRESICDLVELLGYAAVPADAEAALKRIEDGPAVDVLFTDVIMPAPYDGLKLAEAAVRRSPGLKVVFSSGYIGEKFAARLSALTEIMGRTPAVLSKPFGRSDVAKALRGLLDQTEARPLPRPPREN